MNEPTTNTTPAVRALKQLTRLRPQDTTHLTTLHEAGWNISELAHLTNQSRERIYRLLGKPIRNRSTQKEPTP